MVKSKSAEEAVENRVKGAIITFAVKNEKNLNWVMSIIKDEKYGLRIPKENLENILNRLDSYYPNNVKLQKVTSECKEEALLN